MTDITSLLGLGKPLKTCLVYIGIVESIDKKVDLLLKVEFETGLKNFKQASNSKSKEEEKLLFREARSCFNKATSLEKNERLALSYLGLFFCYHYLEEYPNAKESLKNLLNVEIIAPIAAVGKGFDDNLEKGDKFRSENSTAIMIGGAALTTVVAVAATPYIAGYALGMVVFGGWTYGKMAKWGVKGAVGAGKFVENRFLENKRVKLEKLKEDVELIISEYSEEDGVLLLLPTEMTTTRE